MTTTLNSGLDLLARLDLPPTITADETVDIHTPTGRRRARPFVPSTGPTPSRVDLHLEALAHDGKRDSLLYLVPQATSSLLSRARADHRVIVASIADRLVILDGIDHILPGEPSNDALKPRARGRLPWGKLAVARALLRTTKPRPQIELAAEAGITQQSTHAALHALADYGVRSSRGWFTTDPAALWDYALTAYPGPQGSRRGWVSVAPLRDQVERVLALDSGARKLLSGDEAADRLAPWRRGRRAVFYASRDIELSERFAPADDGDEATLEIVVPRDLTIFATASAYPQGGEPMTDPLITAWEVLRSPGPDSRDAAQHLKEAVLKRRVEA
ncbi:hypothetical protein GCM10025867_46260 (plasmid) [Frondihabitans sucicola]|uniref:Transcriptional regulator n=1 Tax=Frondihabitans sucicola TaxID=1268041 RepID=A0ABM8GVB8_9MICO|nr:hypothetical protein [Frondihabitans sucicola]BDZ52385.1 hypothetical protein GCM10025867_46260 [Frondihabitans sucicola]